MSDELDQIRQRVDIYDLVSQRVSLKRAGKNWKGLCPFHEDKNPSFSVDSTVGRYRCWSCGAKGDIFNWVMETQRVEFVEALKILAQMAGVKLAQRERVDPTEREIRVQIMASALIFFRSEFAKSKVAQDYVEKRGIDEATLQKWEIGYAPEIGEALATHLKKAGFPLAEAKELFLVDRDGGGGYFDKFRGRLIFPIRDERGNLVAFGGRIIGDGNPKYINSSDTPIYSKSRVLYGMDRAKEAIQKEGVAVLVEGYLDVIACHIGGLGTAIASLGTALAEEHVRLLKRWTNRVVILYDSDSAGQKAAERATELLQAADITVTIADLPEGEDPDTLLKAQGQAALRRVVETAKTPTQFRLERLQARLGTDKDEFWREVIPILAAAPNPLELERYLIPLASQYPGISDRTAARSALLRMVRAARQPAKSKARAVTPLPALDLRREVNGPESAVLRAALDEGWRREVWPTILETDLFTTSLARRMTRRLADAWPSQPPAGPPKDWIGQLEDDELQDLAMLLLDDETPFEEPVIREAIHRLQMNRTQREVSEMRTQGALDDAALREYNERLRKLQEARTNI